MGEPDRQVDDVTLTRNWSELLQEIRVVQTGVQILTGFLLTVPFSSRFTSLDHLQRTTFLVVLCGSVLTTALVVAPVAFHRLLFRQRRRRWLVEAANRCARAGLVVLALTICGVLFLVFDVAAGRLSALAALVVSLVLFGVLWGVVPLRQELEGPPGPDASPDPPGPLG